MVKMLTATRAAAEAEGTSAKRSKSLRLLLVMGGLVAAVIATGGFVMRNNAAISMNRVQQTTSVVGSPAARIRIMHNMPSLSELTHTRQSHDQDKRACKRAKGMVYMEDSIKNKKSATSKIPRIIHQTSKSRCLTQRFAETTKPWRSLKGYDYYLHDDDAMIRLLTTHSDDFPMLHDLVMADCLPHGTLKADVWRYLVLWIYGGIYADLDTQPTPKLIGNLTTVISDTDDAWFVVEQYHLLSQWVMAASPRHPIMYYAIHRATDNMLNQRDTKKVNAAFVTGPHTLHWAMQTFCHDAGITVGPPATGFKPVWAGTWRGTNNRTITVVGKGEHETEFVIREKLRLHDKKQQYAQMNMTSFHDDEKQESGHSCWTAMFQYHNRVHDSKNNYTVGI